MEKDFREEGAQHEGNFFEKERKANPNREVRSGGERDFGNRSWNRERPDDRKPRSFNPNFDRNNRPKRPFNRDNDSDSRGFGRREEGGSFNRERRFDQRGGFDRNRDDKREYRGEGRPFNNSREQGGDRPYGNDRPRFGERRFDQRGGFDRNRDDKQEYRGERRPFNNDREQGTDRPRFGERRFGPRGNFDRDREHKGEYRGERRPFNGDRDDKGGFRGGFRKEGDRPFTRDDRGGRDFGSRKEYTPGNRYPKREYGDGGDRFNREERRPFNRERSFGSEERGDRSERPRFGERYFEQRGGFDRNRNSDRRNDRFSDRNGMRKERRFDKRDQEPVRPVQPDAEPNVVIELLKGDIRLNRYVSMSGICSRREADELIEAGRIAVNGVVTKELGTKVTVDDIITYDGKVIRGEPNVYILMNKPKDYVTTLEDEHADKIVTDLLGDKVPERVYPVGRLDKNSTGILILTNDGELTKILTHPSYNKKKIYQVSLDKALSEEDMEKVATGVELEDGVAFADEVSCVEGNRKEIGVEIHSGRNRIVRRMFEHLGYKVRKLDRVYFAGLTKKGVARGKWRYLSPLEVEMLKRPGK